MTMKQLFTSPESRAALALVKSHVASIVPASYFDREALRITGASPDTIACEIETLRREFVCELVKLPDRLTDSKVFAFGYAFSTLLAERVDYLQSAESGNA